MDKNLLPFNGLTVLNPKIMLHPLLTYIKISLWATVVGFTKTWKASFLVICSWMSSIFGDNFMEWLDGVHKVIDHIIPIFATVITATAGIWIAVKKGRAELKKIEEERAQDILDHKADRNREKQRHIVSLIKHLKANGEIPDDMPFEKCVEYINEVMLKINGK